MELSKCTAQVTTFTHCPVTSKRLTLFPREASALFSPPNRRAQHNSFAWTWYQIWDRIWYQKHINELILGYNINWKQNLNIGKKNNFNFHYIPYKKLINFLFYKGEQNGIQIKETEESYTSKCDAFALEEIKKHDSYTGKRIKRGLFRSKDGTLLNADVNGAINIMRKYCYKTYNNLKDSLNMFIKQSKSFICNPIKLSSIEILKTGLDGLILSYSSIGVVTALN